MTWSHFATSALILLVVLFGLTLTLPLTASVATETHSPSDSHAPPPLGLRLPEGENEARKGGLPQRERAEEEEEEEDELFGDMDPKTLAAVLLEAMNKPYGERRNGGVEDRRKEKERGEEENEGERQEEEKEKGEEVRAVLDEGADRNRDGREELELVMAAAAAQGKEERERDEEKERKRVQEEEERLTEKVTSRTTSQTIPVKEEQPPAEGERGEEVGVQEVGAREDAQQGPPTSQETQQEEQLSPEEVQNLQSMLEELQNYNTANKRERESQAQEQRGRESRGYSQDDTDQALIHNQIKPKAKGYPRAMSKKLKWQEEMQKALNMPTYRGGNFMDDFDNNLARPAAEEEDDDDDDDEEMLSPEEEERRAKEEQEEVRRQAAEAQRAKAEEEKLADIASDMLLQYMVKQDKGKYQNKKTLLSNAAEDKRSDEEVSEDDDIDAQTIDKLIEMSSKLHLPADDVVDIISDVEKKKKKDAPETLPWQRPLQRPLVYPAAKAIDAQPSPPRYPTLKQPLPAINPLKAWFKDKSSIKPSNQDQNLWIKPQQKTFRTSSNYPTYPFYQQKPYRGYYPIYFPPPKPKPRYYAKPSFTLNDLLSNSLDYDFDFPPKRRYRPWVQPRPRKPPAALRRNLYYPNYSNYPNYLLPPHPRTYNPLPVPMPKPRSSPSRGQVQPRHRHGYYYQAPSAPLVTRDQDYYGMQGIGMGPQQQDSDEDLENYIQQVFMKPRPRMFQ